MPLSPPTYSNNRLKPHVNGNPHSSCGPFTDTHLRHCAGNLSTAGSHPYIDGTGTRKNYGQPLAITTSSAMGLLCPFQQSKQRFTSSATSEAFQRPKREP
jgi:hypothetical protein